MNRFDKNIKNYLTRVLKQYNEGKLTEGEEMQFFQDLADTGFGWQIGKDFADLMNSIIAAKVIEAPKSGYAPELPKRIELMKIKKVTLN